MPEAIRKHTIIKPSLIKLNLRARAFPHPHLFCWHLDTHLEHHLSSSWFTLSWNITKHIIRIKCYFTEKIFIYDTFKIPYHHLHGNNEDNQRISVSVRRWVSEPFLLSKLLIELNWVFNDWENLLEQNCPLFQNNVFSF